MQQPDKVTATIRQPLLRGRQAVAGIWFPSDWFDPVMRARRLIACWRPGSIAVRFSRGDLLCYATATEEDCGNLPGWPLRQEGRALCSAPLTDLERASLPAADAWIVLGAEVLALRVAEGVLLDPAAWLAVRSLSLHETYDCRSTLPVPVVLDLESRPLREVLGNAVAPASPEQTAFMQAVQQAQRERANNSKPAKRPAGGGHSSPLGIFITAVQLACVAILMAAIVSQGAATSLPLIIGALALLALWNRGGGSAGGVLSGLVSKVTAPGKASNAALPARKKRVEPQRWRQWLARVAMMSQLSQLLGRAQARYVRRVLGLFEDGNLEEALRHAIPLGGDRGSLGQAFGTPGRRSDLTLTSAQGPATSVNLGEQLENHLRKLYRQAFERLDRQNRIDEAVFVLAELLHVKQEALDYLEKHQRFAQAAELALGWDLPADVIVRLHCLAGDWRRAVAVARRDAAFANAVLQLEKRWPDAARRLREEWGQALMQQGDWSGAVEAVWPIESLRARAAEWLLTAESAGGQLAARALVQRASLLPDTMERYAEHLQELQSDLSLSQQRASMAEALLGLERGQAGRDLAAIIAPAVLADHAQGQGRFDKRTLQQLMQLSGDVLLQADLPNGEWPIAEVAPLAKRPAALCLDAPAGGTHAILDAVPLHDQRYLLALGEAGARVIDSTGRTCAHFAVPAQRLVLATSRQVALLLACRESLWRVSRLDLARGTIVDLGSCEIDAFATEFDGLHWTVARGRRVQVLDCQRSLQEVVWQVTDLPGAVYSLTASATQELILLAGEGLAQLWAYQLPQRRLLYRHDVTSMEGSLPLLNPTAGLVNIAVERPTPEEIHLRWRSGGKEVGFRLITTRAEELNLSSAGEWLIASSLGESGYLVQWLLLASGGACAQVRWPADGWPIVRAYGNEWLLFDNSGRLLCLDTSTGGHQSVAVR